MARFDFRLSTYQRVCDARRDGARARLADALRAAELLRGRRTDVDRRLAALVDDRRRATAGDAPDIPLLMAAQRYEVALRAEGQQIDADIAKVEQEAESRRQALVEAERDARAVEKLEQRARARHEAHELRREALALDEFASQRAARALAGGALGHAPSEATP